MNYIYDIEVFPNLFCVSFLNVETNDVELFSIHKERNDIDKLIEFINRPITLIGYNNQMYDNTVMQFLIQNKDEKDLLKKTFEFSGKLISSDRNNFSNRRYTYPENVKYKQIDLMKVIEINGVAPSLKQVAINLKWHKIQDLPLPYDYYIKSKNEENLIYEYNLNDVLISNKLYNFLLPRIDLRKKLSELYNVSLMSASNSKMADIILEKYYSDELNLNISEIRNLRTSRNNFSLSECIAKNIHFETNFFNRVMKEIGNVIVRKANNFTYSKTFEFAGVEYSMGVGGLHSIDKPNIFISNDEWKIYDLDVASFYPSMMILNKIVPQHLGQDFTKVLEKLTNERLEAKKNDKIKAEALKVTINSIFGKLGSETFWLQDEKALRSVTVSGQLYLLKLIEKLVLSGINVISANTDGVVSRVHISQEEKYNEIAEWWQKETGFTLEKTPYSLYFRQDVNNYITKKADGEIKSKGRYVREIGIEKGYKSPIVPIAMYEFILNNVPVENTIRTHKDILDFCISQKSSKDFQMQYHHANGKIENLQKNNRFYIANSGGTLIKHHKEKGNDIGLAVGKKVKILNDYDTRIPIDYYDIDYSFYIEEAEKYTKDVTIYNSELIPFQDEPQGFVPANDNREKEEFFYQFRKVKNLSDVFVDNLLWLNTNFQGNNFYEYLVFAENNKKISSKIATMIKINYYRNYGSRKKLLWFFQEFVAGKNKYSSTLSDKTKSFRLLELKNQWDSYTESPENIKEIVESECSVLGEPCSKFENIDVRNVYIIKVDTSRYSPRVTAYCLAKGTQSILKIQKRTFENKQLKVGDYIYCTNLSKKKPVKYIDNIPVEIPNADYEWWIDSYKILSQNDGIFTIDNNAKM